MTKYVLRYFKDIDGQPAWFKGMTAIGPELTRELSEAMRFAAAQEAEMSPGNLHPLCPMRTEEAP